MLYAFDKNAIKAFENGEVYARLNSSSPSFRLKKEDYFGLYNRSRHMSNLKMFYSFEPLKMDTSLRGTYRSKYGLIDTNGNTFLDTYDNFVDGFVVIDFAINKTFLDNYQLGFGIDNLFDFKDSQNISNIAGRIIYGKLNIQF